MKYFKLIEIKRVNERLQGQLQENSCPKCGDQLVSAHYPNNVMQDWDEYEYTCDIKKLIVHKCIDSKCDGMFVSMDIGDMKR
jgi:hypothetical protein